MTFKITSLILMIFLLASCGEKKASSVVSLKILKGNELANGALLDGGVLLMGRSEDGKNSFRTGVQGTDNVDLELPKGRWEFVAVAWQGDGPMTGDNRCSYSGFIDLKDDQAKVSFDLAKEYCKKDFNGRQFANPNHMDASGKFFNFRPVMCLDDSPPSVVCNVGVNTTLLQSYRVVYKADMSGQVNGNLKPLISNCLPLVGGDTTTLPVTDNTNDNPLKVAIRFYKNASCNNEVNLAYNFSEGILNYLNLPDWSLVNYSSPYTNFYVNPGVKFNAEIINPATLTMTGLTYGAYQAFSSTTLNYNVSLAPSANVEMFCLTTNTFCNDAEWEQIGLLGTSVANNLTSEGNNNIYLFYKTKAGVVSNTPSASQVYYDPTSPEKTDMPIVVDSLGHIDVSWTTGDSSSFYRWVVQICSNASCSTVVTSQVGTSFSSKTIPFTDSVHLTSLTNGNTYYVRVKTVDIFSRVSFSNINSFTLVK